MTPDWTFGDLEFVVLWSEHDEDELPHPFVCTSRIPLHDDYVREFARARERLRDSVPSEVREVLRMVARPEIRIAVRAADARVPKDPASSIRLLGIVRGGQAYLLRQLPGETVDHSAGFTIAACDPAELADAVVAALPDAPPGRRARLVLDVLSDRLDYSCERYRALESFEDTELEIARRFVAAVPSRVGWVEVAQGVSDFGPRGRVSRLLRWRELPGDGRYVIVPGPPTVARSADARTFAALIGNEIAEVAAGVADERRSLAHRLR
ncbi:MULTISPECIES: ESX secretion-associated protein EspG [unclassified Nocardia]|uniref:ESX secretion-associated protein EspG n=1 Tax=unclassified Nocardia TaxID=2637762 RepID=UPI00278C6F63|nr:MULTISPECIES: ESX secretion-associated protein EspG [unclassified Nocardia]